MYIARIPLRVSLLGGGSDLPEFYEAGDVGEVIGFAIKKYITIYASLPILIDKSIVKYSKTETFDHPSEIKHPLFREALKIYWNNAKKIELASFADIRSGTGLGSSSIFTVGLIGLLKKLNNQSFTPYSLTKDGFNIERKILKDPVGLQDGAYGAYGGCCHFRFSKGDKIEHASVNLYEQDIQRIKDCFFLVFTNQSRDANECLQNHTSALSLASKKRESQSKIVAFVEEGKKALQNGDYEHLGNLILESYKLKKDLNKSISSRNKNSVINDIEVLLENQSIYGYKLLGAGGGGFFLVIGKDIECKEYLNSVGLNPIAIEIDNKGCSIFQTIATD